MRMTFKVQGSAAEPYDVTFEREGSMVFASCTCAAGQAQQACKHRVNLLTGDVTALDVADQARAGELSDMLEGTELLAALSRVAAAEAGLERAKRELNAEKKRLGRLMHR